MFFMSRVSEEIIFHLSLKTTSKASLEKAVLVWQSLLLSHHTIIFSSRIYSLPSDKHRLFSTVSISFPLFPAPIPLNTWNERRQCSGYLKNLRLILFLGRRSSFNPFQALRRLYFNFLYFPLCKGNGRGGSVKTRGWERSCFCPFPPFSPLGSRLCLVPGI